MTFEEWCHGTGMDDARVVKCDMVSMEILKECWDYQVKEIKSIKEQLKESNRRRDIAEECMDYMEDLIRKIPKGNIRHPIDSTAIRKVLERARETRAKR